MLKFFFTAIPLSLVSVILVVGVVLLGQETLAWHAQAQLAAEREFREGQLAHDQALAAEYQSALAAIDSYFVSDDDLPGLIQTLEETARQAGVDFELTEVSPSANKKVPGLVFAVRFEGAYAAAERFIYLVERLPYLTKIDSASLELLEPGAGSKPSLWSGSLRLTIESYEN